MDDFYGNLGATLKSRNDISQLYNYEGQKKRYRQNIVSTSEKERLVGDATCVGNSCVKHFFLGSKFEMVPKIQFREITIVPVLPSVVSILLNINGFHKFTCCDILPIAVLEI